MLVRQFALALGESHEGVGYWEETGNPNARLFRIMFEMKLTAFHN